MSSFHCQDIIDRQSTYTAATQKVFSNHLNRYFFSPWESKRNGVKEVKKNVLCVNIRRNITGENTERVSDEKWERSVWSEGRNVRKVAVRWAKEDNWNNEMPYDLHGKHNDALHDIAIYLVFFNMKHAIADGNESRCMILLLLLLRTRVSSSTETPYSFLIELISDLSPASFRRCALFVN